VLAGLIARKRGWQTTVVQTAGAFTLGGRGWPANLVEFAYAVAAIIILSIQTPHTAGQRLPRAPLVPVSASIVAVVRRA
jgi:hypothetical protein